MRLSEAHNNEFLEMLKLKLPEEWSILMPRFVEAPARYVSEKHVAATYLSNMYLYETTEGHIGAGSEIATWVGAELARHRMPYYYVSEKLLEALLLTDLPETIRWPELDYPLPAATFMLPEGMVKHPTEGSVYWISYAMAPIGTYIRNPVFNRVMEMRADKPGITHTFLVLTSTMEAPLSPLYHVVLNNDAPFVSMEAIEDAMQGLPNNPGSDGRYGPFDMKTDEIDDRFNNLIASLVFRLILTWEAEPALVSKGGFTGKRLKTGREIWTPNFIGRNYKHETTTQGSEPGGGGWTVRPHWRRGHYRQQRYGVGLSQRKTLWIKPKFVNAGAVA